MDDQHDLAGRLKAISTEVLPAEVKARHLGHLRDELATTDEETPSPWSTQRRLVLSAAALVVLLGSAAALIMAGRALPGDGLYGTKRAMEALTGVVNADIAASHRVEELEMLIERRADPATILAAQSRLSADLEPLADDHPLRQRERQLVLRPSATADQFDVAIDWSGGESFASSLIDGELLFVERRTDEAGSNRFQLTATGSWELTDRAGVWVLTDGGAGEMHAGKAMLGLRIDDAGVTILTGVLGRPAGSQQDAPPISVEPRSTLTTDRSTTPSASSTTVATITVVTPSTSGPPTTPRPTTTTTTTSSQPTTTKPGTTSSRPTTTTTPSTIKTTPSTTSTTRPTTTTSGDDDDD